MIFEEVVNSVLRRYHITESMEQESGPAIVKRLHELLDQTPQRNPSSPENAGITPIQGLVSEATSVEQRSGLTLLGNPLAEESSAGVSPADLNDHISISRSRDHDRS